jgi:hypothetical protein
LSRSTAVARDVIDEGISRHCVDGASEVGVVCFSSDNRLQQLTRVCSIRDNLAVVGYKSGICGSGVAGDGFRIGGRLRETYRANDYRGLCLRRIIVGTIAIRGGWKSEPGSERQGRERDRGYYHDQSNALDFHRCQGLLHL